jgi:hypothetical protein
MGMSNQLKKVWQNIGRSVQFAMEIKDDIKTIYAKSQSDWRKWLEKNHQSEKSIWLIIYKKEIGTPRV